MSSDSRDEYANRIPNPEHISLSTWYHIPKIKNHPLSSFAELRCLCCCLIKSLAAASLTEYVATHSPQTGYLRPCELNTRFIQSPICLCAIFDLCRLLRIVDTVFFSFSWSCEEFRNQPFRCFSPILIPTMRFFFPLCRHRVILEVFLEFLPVFNTSPFDFWRPV